MVYHTFGLKDSKPVPKHHRQKKQKTKKGAKKGDLKRMQIRRQLTDKNPHDGQNSGKCRCPQNSRNSLQGKQFGKHVGFDR